jgi:uncharacterized protein (DUF58 family)
MILSSSEFRLLERLRLNPNKAFPGRVRGERLTTRRGLSIEFADYREYTEGDDLRHLDWNVLARLDQPIMKTYRDEEDLAVHVLIDASASMSFGEPTKLAQARKIGAALCYAALMGGDAVYPAAIGEPPSKPQPLRARSSYPRFCRWANRLGADGTVSLEASVKSFAASSARPGIVMLLTDGMDPNTVSAIRFLAGRGHEVNLLQVLTPMELRPDIEGDLRLIDIEGGPPVDITANSITLKEYDRNLNAHIDSLKTEVLRVGGRYALTTTDEVLEDIVRDHFIRGRWLAA